MVKHVRIPLDRGYCSVQYCGHGRPLLLLHAGIADSRMWQPQFEALCPGLTIMAPDLRGYGQSPLPNGPFSHHDDISKVLDHFEIESSWIAGISFGSYLAANYCLEHPDRVEGLVLLAATVGGFIPDQRIRDYKKKEDELLSIGDIEAATELNLRTWFDGPHRTQSEVDSELRAMVGRMQADAFRVPEPAAAIAVDEAVESIEHYQQISCPVMIAVGDQDQPAVIKHVEQLAREIPGAIIEVIEGAGHMINLEKPKPVNKLLTTALH